MKTQRRLPVVLAAVLLSTGIGFAPVADASHSWGGYHWARTANPFSLGTGDNVSSAWDDYLNQAISDWSASSVLDLVKEAGGAKKAKSCRATSGRIEVCNANYGNTGWLGLAQIWISGLHITQGRTQLNDTYFNTATYNTPPWRRLVMCQEIAHDFGLDHQDENFDNPNLGTCMDYTSDPDGPPSNEHPNQHDYDEIVTIYGHLDSTTTVGSATAARGASQEVDRQDQWGRARRYDSRGRPSVYERDFGGSKKVVTFVIWA
jgi:hypothetical protein